MSFESWAGSADAPVKCRLPSCGHTIDLVASADASFECPICVEERPEQSGLAIRDYVPTPDLTWQGATCNKTTRLNVQSHNANCARIEAIDDLVAALSSPKLQCLHLRTAALRPYSPLPKARRNSFAVWRAATLGCAVHDGTVELPERGVLLLAGAGAHFHGTTFKGGIVICAGPQSSGTFQNCTFHSTTVYAVHGATVTLRSSTFRQCRLGLIVNGQATSATLNDCTFRRCRTSVIVEAGATAYCSHCLLLKTDFAIIVNEVGSHVALESCTVWGSISVEDFGGDTGVTVRRSTATLRSCSLKNFCTAVDLDRSMVEVQRMQIVHCSQGVLMKTRTRLVLRDCTIRMTLPSTPDPAAVAAFDYGDSKGSVRIQLERCTVRGCLPSARALIIDDGTVAAATLCRFDCANDVASVGAFGSGGCLTLEHCTGISQQVCLLAAANARLRVRGGRYEGGMSACAVEHGAKLTATACEFLGRDDLPRRASGKPQKFVGVVAVVGEATQAWLSSCSIHGGCMGVFVVQATVTAVNTCIYDVRTLLTPGSTRWLPCSESSDEKGGAGFMCLSGRLSVRGGSVRRCVIGVETGNLENAPNVVTLDGVECTDCVYGADFADPCRADLERCVFRRLEAGSTRTPEVEALQKAGDRRHCEKSDAGMSMSCMHASVRHCSVSGFDVAVEVTRDGAEVSVSDCDLSVVSEDGLGLAVMGKVSVEDCRFHGAGAKACGIAAAGTAACAVRRCRFRGKAYAAIEAQEHASVSIVDSSVAGPCDHGFVVCGQAQLAAQDCRVTDAEVAVHVFATGGVFTAKRVTLQARRACVTLPAAPWHGGRLTVIKLVDSVLSSAETGVWATDAAADVAVVRCDVAAVETGVLLTGPINARIKGGCISGCRTGVAVGTILDLQQGPCEVCGMSGQLAMRSAAAAALAGGRGGALTAVPRCTHEGAVVRLAMADCEVARCSVAGVRMNILGRLKADGVTARDCGHGFLIDVKRDGCSFERCRAVGCGVGISGSRHGALKNALCVPYPMAGDSAELFQGVEVLPM